MSPRLSSLLACLVCLVAACGGAPRTGPDLAAQQPPPPPSVAPIPVVAPALDPPQPTLRLPRNFVPAGYHARLAIDPASDRFTGAIEIDGDVRERSKTIWLHGRGIQV